MKIAVISDLHLNHENATDQFKHDITEFVRFLKYLEDNFEVIILLGDIYETLMSWNHKASLAKCIEKYKEICSRFTNKKYKYIKGNHDHVAGKYLNASEDLIINSNGHKLYFTHGHQFDLLQGNLRLISEIGVLFGGCMIRNKLNKIYNYIYSLDMASSCDLIDLKQISKGVIKLAVKHNADIVVTGHSHIGIVEEYGNNIIMNSGTCSNGKYSFLSIDTVKEIFTLNTSW